jgi:Notch-like protein
VVTFFLRFSPPDNRAPVFVTSSVFYALRGKELRVQLNANDPENRTVRYSFGQNQRFGASLNKNGSFVWTKNTNDSTTFTFNVTDECGAYSTLTVSVVIKECPCRNSGECFLDYRDMDGGGNFTCSCPSEYTGALCELDVNECNASNPCFNGSCINQQPGFSCSCSNGYTGRLCESEVSSFINTVHDEVNLTKLSKIRYISTVFSTGLLEHDDFKAAWIQVI